ncbi:hypothetical protein DPMN_125861 [Dreissena polymorpha]|uniref:Uncharacterized protein n=1 Tax=Dreissena polymorpha TaxID=45954 RepID=A0A9D4GW18_DREPO|nr:hypothetical protein DPMN_125861 [Dreissena polymorpha]
MMMMMMMMMLMRSLMTIINRTSELKHFRALLEFERIMQTENKARLQKEYDRKRAIRLYCADSVGKGEDDDADAAADDDDDDDYEEEEQDDHDDNDDHDD